jgi:16S rRNA pseudouridine516 synthase
MPSIEKLLARNLGCSRAEARRLLGRVGGGPECRRTPHATWLHELPSDALPFRLQLAGRVVELYDSFHLMLHKPTGCVTALSDGNHATAASMVADAPLRSELRAVGRLDLDTSGLLLWTTDGAWLHRLTHPRTALPRGYHVALARPFLAPPAELVLRDGHRPHILELRALSAAEAHPALARSSDAHTIAAITIAGGAYHEVRRIFAALGSHVLGLCRVSFGTLLLPTDLGPGQWRQIDQRDVEK